MSKRKRKYPCQARLKANVWEKFQLRNKKLRGLPEPKEITLLHSAEYIDYGWSTRYRYRVELPEGYPDPPSCCSAWLIDPSCVKFIDD